MTFMDDIKTDQKTQIMVAGMLFFALAFPGYFYILGGQEAESYSIEGPVGNYTVNGTTSLHEIGSGSELVDDGTTVVIGANSDAGGVDGLNIIGFIITISHTDDEGGGGPQCAGVANQDDEVSVSGGIDEYATNMSGDQSEMSQLLFFVPYFGIFENMTPNEISRIMNPMEDVGFGEYSFGIEVTVNKGERPLCNKQDSGETVDWKIELISLDSYSIELIESEEEAEE